MNFLNYVVSKLWPFREIEHENDDDRPSEVEDDDDDDVCSDVDGASKMAPKTKSIPSIVRDTTLFLRDLSRTSNEIVLDKVRPVVDNAAARRRDAAAQKFRGPIPGNLEWPKVLLEFVAEERLKGFCIDAVFQVLTAPCDHPCPSEMTSTIAQLTVKSFLDNQSLVQECRVKSKFPVQEVCEKIEDVSQPYDALSVTQRLMTHLTYVASSWLREGVSGERCALASVLKDREANHDYNCLVTPVVDPANSAEEDSEFEDSDSDDERLNSCDSPSLPPLRPDVLPPPSQQIQNTYYQGFVHAIKNTRRKMEDRHVIIPDLNQTFNVDIPGGGSLFAVFDGHGGLEASAFAAAQLPAIFADLLTKQKEEKEKVEKDKKEENSKDENEKHKIEKEENKDDSDKEKGDKDKDNKENEVVVSVDPIDAFNRAFKKVDQQFAAKAKSEGLKSGSTGVAAFIQNSSLYFSWLGDSQALLLRRVPGLSVNPIPAPQNGATGNGVDHKSDDDVDSNEGECHSNGKQDPGPLPPHYPLPLEIMLPHRPDREDEKRRIEALGGIVIWFGTWRVNGSIAVSRSIGDVDFKPFVSANCDTRKVELGSDDDLLILGCDGLFDTLDPNNIAKCVYEHLSESGSVATLPQKLVKEAKSQGSGDNITALVVPLIHHKKREWDSDKDVAYIAEEFSHLSTESDHEAGEEEEDDEEYDEEEEENEEVDVKLSGP